MDDRAGRWAGWVFAGSLLLLAAAALAWWLADRRGYITYELRSREPVSGLLAGAPVEFHGVDVGQVTQVELLDPRNVRVLLQVRRNAPVTSATIATITGRGLATRGFTGYVYVSLEDGSAPGRPLTPAAGEAHARIATAPAQSENLDVAMAQLNRSVQAATALLQAALDPRTVASLKQSLASIEQVSQTLAANDARLTATLANAERASARMQPLLQSSSDAVQVLQAQLLPQARGTLAEMAPLLQASSEAAQVLQLQVLPDTQRALLRLDRVTNSMDATATLLRRDPSVLLRRAAAVTPGPGEAP